MMAEVYSVILAGGKGTRMKSDLPKVLLKINNKTLIEYCVETAQSLKLTKVIVVVGYKRELVQGILGNSVDYAIQGEQLGTGHALMQTKNILAQADGYVLVSNGDMPFISPKMFKDLYSACIKKGAAAAMMSVKTKDFSSWGRVVRDRRGDVKKIVEAKDADQKILEIEEKNAGIYCFSIKDLFFALEKIKSNNAQKEYYLTDVVEILSDSNKKIISIITTKYNNIVGINTPAELLQAKKILKNGNN